MTTTTLKERPALKAVRSIDLLAGVKLHLGSGTRYREGWVNVDCADSVKCDVRHNLDVIPWPFGDECACEVEMYAVLEHLKDTLATLGELHRVMRPGATCHIHVPYACSVWAFQDPTHFRYFTERTLDYVKDGFDYNFYTGVRFEILKAELTSGTNSGMARLRNLIPGRRILRWFLWNMFDGVDFVIRKP
jgi:hypothetical protein